MGYTKIITGENFSRRTGYGEWVLNGRRYWVQGELYYNDELDCFEHYYEGPRGGRYLVRFY